MVAVKKDVLLFLYIVSIAQVTSRGGIVSPGHNFILRVWARSLKRATLQMTLRGRSRSMGLGSL